MPFPIRWESYQSLSPVWKPGMYAKAHTFQTVVLFFLFNQSSFLTPVTACRIYLLSHGSVLCVLWSSIHIAVGATVSSKLPDIYSLRISLTKDCCNCHYRHRE